MSCELWAIDAGAGEAIFFHEGEWYFVSLEGDLNPQKLQGEYEAIRWSFSGLVAAVGRQYEHVDQIKSEVKSAYLLTRFKKVFLGCLNKIATYSTSLGLPTSRALNLSGEVLNDLYEGKEWLRFGMDIDVELFKCILGSDLVKSAIKNEDSMPGIVKGPLLATSDANQFEEKRHDQILAGLSRIEQRCLILWVESDLKIDEIAKIMRIQAKDVKGYLDKVAGALQLSHSEMLVRRSRIADKCRRLLIM